MLASLIIPTRNRAKELTATLKSISIQQRLAEIEVIVIDNGSTDSTKQVVADYQNQIPNLVYEYNDIPGLLTGRHRGAEMAQTNILCFLDDDVELNPNYTSALIDLFQSDASIQLATGPCLPNYEVSPPEWLSYLWDDVAEGKYCAWLSLLDFGQTRRDIDPNFVWGLNFCIRKNILLELGGFHPDCIPDHLQQYQGDGETGLTLKAIEKKYRAVYEPGLALKHYVPKERLVEKYYHKRAYYQGVCNSYTHLRKQQYQSALLKKSKLKKLRDKLHPYYSWIKKIYQKDEPAILPPQIAELMTEIGKSGKRGYEFHQKHFNEDEKVREWVLKENYWDYRLPNI